MKRTQTTRLSRLLAVLLCLCMILPVASVPALAEGEEYAYTYPDDKPYYEVSMYAYACTDADVAQNLQYPTSIFRLLDAQGNQLLAYCADAAVYDEPGFRYRPVALTALSRTSAQADKLRAVIRNSYPFLTAEEMIARMQEAGVVLHGDVVPSYEMVLISAVQQTIFSLTNPEYTIQHPFTGAIVPDAYEGYRNLIFRFDETYREQASAITEALDEIGADVAAVKEWLQALPGETAPSVTPSASFDARIETAGDSYQLTLYNLSDDVKGGKDLTVTIASGGETVYTGPVLAAADGTIAVSFESDRLTAGGTASVTLAGGKPYEDVVAYESETKEGVQSQPFIGMGTLAAPFSASRDVTIPEKIDISVTKVWSGDGVQPAEVTVRLFDGGTDTGSTLTLSAANGWTGTFTGLDKTRGGAAIPYTVREDAVAGYTSAVTGDAASGFTITNTSNGVVTLRPADVTVYMGGEQGYDAVVASGSDTLDTNNSLPEPLFHIYAPSGADPAALTFVSSDLIPGTQTAKRWTVSVAGQTRDGATLYRLDKADAAQDNVRVQYSAGGSAVTNDQFDPNAVRDLYRDYTTSLYTGAVSAGSVRAVGADGTVYGIRLAQGTLRVRSVELGSGTPQTNPVYEVRSAAPESRLAAGTAAVVAPEGTSYVLNHTTVPAGPDGIGLLFDDIYDKDNGRSLRQNALIAKADAAIGPAGADVTRWHQAKYLDLVDEDNGNAWVKTVGQTVTVVWAYPEGTDAGTDFTLLHFAGLHRDDADQASSGYDVADINAVVPAAVTIRKTGAGIEFDVPSGGFSPFVLIWETARPAAESPAAPSVSAPQTGDAAQPAVWIALAAAAAGASLTIGLLRRRRR